MGCSHDLAEMETMCADGICPLCLRAEVERLKKIVDLQRGALDVWKKAYPSADVVKLAVFVRRNSSSSGRPKVE